MEEYEAVIDTWHFDDFSELFGQTCDGCGEDGATECEEGFFCENCYDS